MERNQEHNVIAKSVSFEVETGSTSYSLNILEQVTLTMPFSFLIC